METCARGRSLELHDKNAMRPGLGPRRIAFYETTPRVYSLRKWSPVEVTIER